MSSARSPSPYEMVDLLTNLATIAPDHFLDEFEQWLGCGTAPPDRLPAFLHEATHHWCFYTPVGSALALLGLRIRRQLLRLAVAAGDQSDAALLQALNRKPKVRELLLKRTQGDASDAALLGALRDNPVLERILLRSKDDDLAARLLDDLVRFNTGVTILRPLAEGLATFAEFDVSSKFGSRVISPVLRWLDLLYEKPHHYLGALEQPLASVIVDCVRHKVVQALRENCVTPNRKVRVLTQPFSTNAQGYLNGYLTVKSLWRTLGGATLRAVNETDLSLMYLRSFFYDDPALVKALLLPKRNPDRSGEAIINRVNERMWQLGEVAKADLDAFEQAVLTSPEVNGGKMTAWPGLMQEETLVAEARDLIEDILHEVIDEAGVTGATFGRYSQELMVRRTLFNFGSATVEVRVTAGEVSVLRHGQLVLNLPSFPETKDGEGCGEVEVMLTMCGYPCRILAVTLDDALVGCKIIGHSSRVEPLRNLVGDTFISRQAVQEIEKDIRKATAQYLEDSRIRDDFERISASVADIVDRLYRDVALRFSFEPGERRTGENVDRTAMSLQDPYGICGLSVGGRKLSEKQVRGMALLGMLCSIAPRRTYLEPAFASAGLDLEETLASIQACHAEHGFPPAPLVVDDCIFTTL
jgi:hypothetical protein